MKEAYVNKDFLPIKYVKERNFKIESGEKRGVTLLVILSLLLFPFSLKSLMRNKREDVNKIVEVKNKKNYYKKEEILLWIGLNIEGVSGSIKASEGKLTVDNKELIKVICEKEKFLVNTIENLGENKYRLQIVKR